MRKCNSVLLLSMVKQVSVYVWWSDQNNETFARLHYWFYWFLFFFVNEELYEQCSIGLYGNLAKFPHSNG